MTNQQFNDMLIKKSLKRYIKENKRGKGKLLDEIVKTTGMHRKSLIRTFNKLQLRGKVKRGGSKPKYLGEAKELIRLVWEANDCICAERLISQIGKTIARLKRFGYLKRYNQKAIKQVKTIPLGTLKEKLRDFHRIRTQKNLNSQGEIRKQIPIRTNFNKVKKAGYFGVDFVDHNGGDAGGKYVRSLCTTDIRSQWITRGATRGRDKQAIEKVVKVCIKRIPFHIHELHSDNETNLISSLLRDFGKRKNIAVTRSRSYHKEDNGHVEQKNRDKIRDLVGYFRMDTRKEEDILNLIYEIDDNYQNHFIASQRLLKKEYNKKGKLVRKKYDEAKTPYQRILEDKNVSIKKKMKLCCNHSKLDPLKLKKERDKLLRKLNRIR